MRHVPALLDIIREDDTEFSFTSVLAEIWPDLSIGVLNFEEWIFPSAFMKPDSSGTERMIRAFRMAYGEIKILGKPFVKDVPLVKADQYELNGRSS